MGIPVMIEAPEPRYEQATEVAVSTRWAVDDMLQEMVSGHMRGVTGVRKRVGLYTEIRL